MPVKALAHDESDDDIRSVGSTDSVGMKSHRCTDIPCLIVFIVSIGFFISTIGWALKNGNPKKLYAGIDVSGNICGVSSGFEALPFLYYCPKTSATGDANTSHPVCIAQCPKVTGEAAAGTAAVEPATISACPIHQAYPTMDISGSYCVPDQSFNADAYAKVSQELTAALDGVAIGAASIRNCWPVLIMAFAIAVLMGYIYIGLMSFLAEYFIWLAAFLTFAGLVAFGIYFWFWEANGDGYIPIQGNQANLCRIAAWVFWLLAGLDLCLVCCCVGAVKLASTCMKTAAIAIWKMPCLLLSPIVKLLVKLGLLIGFAAGMVLLVSTAKVTGSGMNRTLFFEDFQKGLLIFYSFEVLWVLTFITALYQFSVAYAVSRYYNASQEEDGERNVRSCEICRGTMVGFWYHSGSLAFGSAIIATIEFIIWVLRFLEARNKAEGNNLVVRCVLVCLLCFFQCFQSFIQFINKNVYICIAITSDNFCNSVKHVMHIVADHGAAMAILNGVTDILQVIGMASISITVGFICHVVLGSAKFANPESSFFVQNRNIATLFAVLIALAVSWVFMTIFDVASDTLLICYAEDETHGRPQRAPHGMSALVMKAREQVGQKKEESGSESELE